jgi:predicted glycosyltransferase/glycosyltransferase involved in cell wall biosynthesis
VIRNKLYYRIKPLVPARVRLAIRGWMTRRVRDKFRAVWPILPGSERPPKDWPGWPQGRQFAFVLTHDVEGPAGVAKCRQLIEVEKKYGFRSCFNFIPEGDYRVTRELRDELTREGFEVGVHDLRHDGRLFLRHKGFAEKAAAINRYLADWGAVGFRSGFMLHNLDWLLDLDVAYDTSTFDTDPFEPQPDGTGTIFPFWKPGPNGRGYVELPYTLPQDSTMFLLLREPNTEIWLNKLDWIARHGGMALLNVHPDYVAFDPLRKSAIQYPLDRYESFLRHTRELYGHRCWNALPRQVASWFKASCVTSRTQEARVLLPGPLPARSTAAPGKNQRAKPDRAAVVLYSYYETDVRPMREAEALANAGMEVDVICLRHNPSDPLRDRINGVNLFRLPLRRQRSGKMSYLFRYAAFFISAFCRLAFWSFRKRYKLVHVHNMPDFLVFTALLPKLRGAKVILDLHDPMPELFCAIYGISPNHLFARCLRFQERCSISFADLVLTPNQAFKDLFVSRSCPAGKIQISVNVPPTAIFDPGNYVVPAPAAARPFTLMYHGLLVERHGLDLAVRTVATLRPRIPQIKFHLYGEMTGYMATIIRLIRELGLDDVVQYHGFKSLPEIAQDIVSIDLGLVPNRLNDFTRINLPTRIFEYLAMNKPVLVPRTKGIEDYFSDDDMLFFEPGNVADLAAKIEWVHQHPAETQSLIEKGRKVYARYSWDQEEGSFLGVVKDLLAKNKEQRPRHAALPTSRKSIWIDLDNTPHVPLFAPIVQELNRRGYKVVLTARDAFQVCELAEKKNLHCLKIGRHSGKNKFRKVAGLFFRAAELAPVALREKPAIGLSHGSRSQILICNLLRIPTVLMADYEFAKFPRIMSPTWELSPEVIPDAALSCPSANIRKYPGIKEDVYVPDFRPNPAFLQELGLSAEDLIVVVRPPATEAHYHNPEADKLFDHFMDRAFSLENVRIVLLPRNKKQAELLQAESPHWFDRGRTIIPQHAVDGLDLVWHSDLVVSGGGTMNREAAALGVPVYSVFRGKIGAVDLQLQKEGRLTLIENLADVDKIPLVRRRRVAWDGAPRPALTKIVDHVVEIIEHHCWQ